MSERKLTHGQEMLCAHCFEPEFISLRAQVVALQERVKELEENERLGVLKFDALKFPTRQRMREEISRLRADLARVTGDMDFLKADRERAIREHHLAFNLLTAEREKNAALLGDLTYMAYLVEDWKDAAKKQWRLRMTGSACAVCGGQGRISRAAIKLPETYEDCPSCAIDRGPWAWLSDRLTVEDFQRLAKQHGDVVIRVREEGREAERARAKGMRHALEDVIAWFDPETMLEGHGAWPLVRQMVAALSPSPAKEAK